MHFTDLHCDLLSYLAEGKGRSAHDPVSRASLPQLIKGKVRLQTLAVYTETKKGSSLSGARQMETFLALPNIYKEECSLLNSNPLEISNVVQIAPAIENASGVCEEDEDLEVCFRRLDAFLEKAANILYLSLTWNDENRFAGGNLTNVGLKRDGELLLEYLSEKKIAIDLSHTSDKSAEDILNFTLKKNLRMPVIASHSNFRSICRQPRNLPDPFAKEIISRGGIIGLNLVRVFIGGDFLEDLSRHIEHAAFLGGMDHLVLGADFFYDKDITNMRYPLPYFYEPYGNASCYPLLFDHLSGKFSKERLEKIAYKNFESYFQRKAAI